MKLINKIRLSSFMIFFASGAILALGSDKSFVVEKWELLMWVLRISGVIAIGTTFILLIQGFGDYLDKHQKGKDVKRDKKNRR
ncbi:MULTISPECIES: hypothetical protein [unclassified Halomonas]|uniref:hypothetical protein n=1 Tax=unclassified Halomonas TaxID=2609666 RepID=UPI001CF4A617|nr:MULTISPECIES: hypothetical protein [unclassified Halomonas]MCA8866813.1 hypothetical protein [Halomonas sp. SBBP1]UZH11467.1 hypothetical protein OM794_06905 [Halomonas sp. BDJS001]